MMRSRVAFQAFIMLGIMMMSSMGCIGLVPAREIIEVMRSEPELTIKEEKISITHTFSTISFAPYVAEQRFEVDVHVNEVSIFMSASLVYGDNSPLPSGQIQYVEASLVDANGVEVWNQTLTSSDSVMEQHLNEELALGTWVIRVEARGYGESFANMYKDSFQVVVSVERECWEYPNEDFCTFE